MTKPPIPYDELIDIKYDWRAIIMILTEKVLEEFPELPEKRGLLEPDGAINMPWKIEVTGENGLEFVLTLPMPTNPTVPEPKG